MKHLIGIDIGTSGTKTVLLHKPGRLLPPRQSSTRSISRKTAMPSRTRPIGGGRRFLPLKLFCKKAVSIKQASPASDYPGKCTGL